MRYVLERVVFIVKSEHFSLSLFYIPHQSAIFSSFHGTSFKKGSVLIFGERFPIFFFHFKEGFRRLELRSLAGNGKAIPWTGFLTFVAAIYPIAHFLGFCERNGFTVFDGQV